MHINVTEPRLINIAELAFDFHGARTYKIYEALESFCHDDTKWVDTRMRRHYNRMKGKWYTQMILRNNRGKNNDWKRFIMALTTYQLDVDILALRC